MNTANIICREPVLLVEFSKNSIRGVCQGIGLNIIHLRWISNTMDVSQDLIERTWLKLGLYAS